MSCGEKKTCCKALIEESDYLICTCMGVMKSEIEDAIKRGSTSLDALSRELGVGTGCSSCIVEINDLCKKNKE